MENYERNIVDPNYVCEKLGAKNFKVIDCTVYFELKKVGASTIHSGYENYLKRHIPGSAYLHMVDDLSEKDNPIPFSIVSQEKLNEKLYATSLQMDKSQKLQIQSSLQNIVPKRICSHHAKGQGWSTQVSK